jgi:hypothetical protein
MGKAQLYHGILGIACEVWLFLFFPDFLDPGLKGAVLRV